ncbi:MAG TPA: MaoC/PaaZ C-terminal domain-containing protein [Pseudonocardia sp.]
METTTLDGPPRLAPRYLRALLPSRGGGTELPDRELVLPGAPVDPAELDAYRRMCGFGLDGRVPVTYPQVLAFAAQVTLMTEPGFPLRLPGLVHLRQRITQLRPVAADEPLGLRVHAEALRAHAKGAQVDLVGSAEVDGEPVWAARSTYLARGATAPPAAADEPDEPVPVPADPARQAARWRVPADTGRRYASVSGDVNPIHLHPLTARLFGFPGAIAHGMWTAARCLATLEGRLPEAYEVDVVFGRPVVLPADVALFSAPDGDGGWRLTLRAAEADRVHLSASVVPSGGARR